MKIVDRKTFLSMPAGTVFSKYQPCVFDDIEIKGESILGGTGDFFAQQIAGAIDSHDCGDFDDKLFIAQEEGTSVALDLECEYRDGMFDADQLFAVWEPDDVLALIQRLQRTLPSSGEGGE